jgi:GNAT superfamily N-acetyltransferase
MHHVAVDVMHRERGIARALVDHCLSRLRPLGIRKCNIFLFRDNGRGADFWQHNGWSARDNFHVTDAGPDVLLCEWWQFGPRLPREGPHSRNRDIR